MKNREVSLGEVVMMTDIRIAVIGGAGGMGAWCVRFFEGRGHAVCVIDKGEEIGPAVAGCAVVVVAVPIHATRAVIEEVGPLLDETALLMDVTSLKEGPVQWMCDSTKAEVIGCHPLFGPSVESIKGLHVVLCPARVSRWKEWPRRLFVAEGAAIIETTPQRHDKMMAIVQALNHLNTMTMGRILSETGITPEELRDYSTPLFELKCSIIERVVKENPRLHAEIVMNNPHIGDITALYEKVLSRMTQLIESGDDDAFVDYLEGGEKKDKGAATGR